MIGEYVREHRNKINKTQTQFAKDVGISQSYLNLIEQNRRRIGKKSISIFAKKLKVTQRELEENNYIVIDSPQRRREQNIKIKKKITEKIEKQKKELDLLILETEETLVYLKNARKGLDSVAKEEDLC